VPANNQKYINKSIDLKSDFIIYDLEESVSPNELIESLNNLRKIVIKNNYYVRPHFFIKPEEINAELLENLIKIGFNNYVIPKLSSIVQLKLIKSFFESIKNYKHDKYNFILLVENPAFLLCLNDALHCNFLNVKSIGFGSHDYCNIMGMKHTLENLYFARQTVLNTAKAFDLEAIDIVSLDLVNDSDFCDEVINGFSMGFDAKFIIHPKHFQLLNKIQYYTHEEVLEANLVYSKIHNLINDKVSVVKIDGKVYEKPHINRIINIINWRNKNGGK
ncbi:MAG: hypothetical protein A2491_08990, partial [Bacteroidetes bacterium RIFOXYC12_FULL_35_7]